MGSKSWDKKMITYIGAENIISPLGVSAEENFKQIAEGETGIKYQKNVGFEKEAIPLSKLKDKTSFYLLISQCLQTVILKSEEKIISSKETIIIISTTK